ncbi:hypothetical protein [Priestia taiwanensis]|uniref:Uncharacterized protein n=1 Tax=Priestia taiwanensis TaxID=1347902 RepID=A0A917AK87_9BACI|nr:hypothetical protein [Priestia taiwanensis]MBM7361804.1 vacuolar-type H+-ATPase subunit I/STV1 [Priestia taiwanensis]GGE57120.1 hypothetical protein GCM10007140_04310 [Priestia taiwanensis]
MLDQEWFIQVLTRKDLAILCNDFKVRVQGFQRSLNNAPVNLLKAAMREALNNGIKRKKNNALVFEEMLKKIVKEVREKCPYLDKLRFEEFIVRVEVDSNILNYETIAVAIFDYPHEYQNNKEKMIENFRNKMYIFNGLSEELSRPVIEKINFLVEEVNLESECYTLLKKFERDNLSSQQNNLYKKIHGKVKTEEQTFKLLTEIDKPNQYVVITVFLLHGNNYKEDKYKFLLEFCIKKIQEYYLERCKHKIVKMQGEKLDYERKNISLNRQIETLNSQYEEKEKYNTCIEEKLSVAVNIGKELQQKHNQLEEIIRQNEPLQMFFLRLVTENQFIIITKDYEEFIHTPFEAVTISPLNFKKQLLNNQNHKFKEQIIFVTRVSFRTGRDWFNFKQTLNDNQLVFEEIGHYEIYYYIKEIVEYLNRKEILVYADEV